MKDANPRIFRSLETAAGSAEFDTIVAAAVASYGALRQPNESQSRGFARLVLPAWDRLKPETKRALGASLSHSPNVPRGIVEKLLDEPIEIGAPFLVSSPVLTARDRQFLASKRDQRLRRLAREGQHRRAAESPETAASTEPSPAAADGAAPSAATQASPAVENDDHAAHAPFERGRAAAAVREALRRMARPGRRLAASGLTMADLVETAVRGDAATTLAAIAAMAGIEETTLSLIAEDETGERLAVALKAVAAPDADAMTIIMMLKPRVGLDVGAFDLMARYYRSLKTNDCLALVGASKRAEAPSLEPIYQDVERVERPTARPAFGRRAERPTDAKSRSA